MKNQHHKKNQYPFLLMKTFYKNIILKIKIYEYEIKFLRFAYFISKYTLISSHFLISKNYKKKKSKTSQSSHLLPSHHISSLHPKTPAGHHRSSSLSPASRSARSRHSTQTRPPQPPSRPVSASTSRPILSSRPLLGPPAQTTVPLTTHSQERPSTSL